MKTLAHKTNFIRMPILAAAFVFALLVDQSWGANHRLDVSVDVDCDDSITKDRVLGYLIAALRRIPDVDIQDALFGIRIDCLVLVRADEYVLSLVASDRSPLS